MSGDHPLSNLLAEVVEKAPTLPTSTRAALITQCAGVIAALSATMLTTPTPTSSPEAPAPEDDEWLSLEDAAKRIGRHPRWFSRRRGRLPFVKKLSGRTIVVSKKGLQRWIAARTA